MLQDAQSVRYQCKTGEKRFRLEAQLEDMRNKSASKDHELQVARKKLREKEKELPKSPFKDAEVLRALPPLPNTSQTISATLLAPKDTKTAMQCLLHLSQKLKQDTSLTAPTQRLVEKLVLAAQVWQYPYTMVQ